MLQSMTGYGKAQKSLNNSRITAEIKSLNSKQCDINVRLPHLVREKELELRKMISEGLQRGKISCMISYEVSGEAQAAKLNTPVVKSYIRQIKRLSEDLSISFNADLFSTALQMPGAVEKEEEELDQDTWYLFRECVQEALDNCQDFRIQEGNALEKDFISRIGRLSAYADSLDPQENSRLEAIKKRLKDRLNEIKNDFEVDQYRFDQEVVYYLEKLDITEEKVRLRNHLDYFLETMKSEQAGGKKLSFVIQEMIREINTIGSKANDSDIQIKVVQMKDEVEKIREQLMNVL